MISCFLAGCGLGALGAEEGMVEVIPPKKSIEEAIWLAEVGGAGELSVIPPKRFRSLKLLDCAGLSFKKSI